ncbi:MAG TPA: alkaline phosphatase family protein, partial [Paraburkholderia sp.]
MRPHRHRRELQVLDALTASPDVWSRTVLIVHFDENDGFFDHVPPPAPPSYTAYHADPSLARFAGKSTVDASDDNLGDDVGGITSTLPYRHHPYGMGPRVPLYVLSPWSRGGWVNSQIFDNTSPIRFIEQRFGVHEPNIGPWRRAVAGDLTSCFDFSDPNHSGVMSRLPSTIALDAKSRTLHRTTTPATPPTPTLPVQEIGTRRSRALPYELYSSASVPPGGNTIELVFANSGDVAAVFHVYDRRDLDALPRRYTVARGKQLSDVWSAAADNGEYDLWVLGPVGYHRHFTGTKVNGGANPEVQIDYDRSDGTLSLKVRNTGTAA